MKRFIGYTAALCLLAFTVGCGGVSNTGTLAYISNSSGTGFTVFTVNTDGTLTLNSISPQSTPAAPKMLQFTANGKWAYFLDAAGANIYAYTRAGNGTLATLIDHYPVNGASSLVIAPNSTFLYVSLPNSQNGQLAVFSIDQSTGILPRWAVPEPRLCNFATGDGSGRRFLFGLAPKPAAGRAVFVERFVRRCNISRHGSVGCRTACQRDDSVGKWLLHVRAGHSRMWASTTAAC